jgi:predicted flavoprotein YhiN
VNTLINDRYEVKGKTTFKEEFVTAGGVDLAEIHVNTMESTICPGLFFAGEVMDIDGITGGFNFQSAWTTGFIAGKNVGNN